MELAVWLELEPAKERDDTAVALIRSFGVAQGLCAKMPVFRDNVDVVGTGDGHMQLVERIGVIEARLEEENNAES